MSPNNDIIILKLGGGLITDKNKPFSLREDIIESALKQIITSEKKIILVHGGGSFGHPIAKTYKIIDGFNPLIKNQILGLAETHDAMNNLNSHIVNIFLEERFPILSLQPSSIFVKTVNKTKLISIDIIETALNLGLMPILYGDIVFNDDKSFSIISGDEIILELCKALQKFKVLKVIFATEVDGIFIKEGKETKIATEIGCEELDMLNLAEMDKKIDVTGGIIGKINSIKSICKLGIEVQLINGLNENFILDALVGKKLKSTNIEPSLIHKAIIEKSEAQKYQEIQNRKIDHLKIPLRKDVQHSENYFKDIKFIHYSIPEIDLDEIDLSTKFFDKKVSAPICIAAITGGHPVSEKLNEILARAAEEENIITSVGSQRIGLINPETQNSFKIVRAVAPNIPIIGNIGIGQICAPEFNLEDFQKCIEMVEADAMAIHLNALHELSQDKGDISYKMFSEKFTDIRDRFKLPIIAKEVGTGLNSEIARRLDGLGFDGFDVGGTGGTSFSAIEAERDKNSIGEIFRDWGIPTPASIVYVRNETDKTIISTGGLKSGIDIARSIALGADIGGFAYKFLVSAWKDYKEKSIQNTVAEIQTLKNELRSSLWLLNLKHIEKLKSNKEKYIITGNFKDWIKD